MRKRWFWSGAPLLLMMMSLAAYEVEPVQSRERGHAAESSKLSDGQDAVTFRWRESKLGYGEFEFCEPVKLEFALPVRIRVAAEGGSFAGVQNLRLRVRDASGETLQFDPAAPGFSRTIEFMIDRGNARDAWGGDGNRLIDGEAKLVGFAIGFPGTGGSGELTLGVPRQYAVNGPGIAFQLGGVGEFAVVTPEKEEQLTLKFTNRADRGRSLSVECTFTDYYDRSFSLAGGGELAPDETLELPLRRTFPSRGFYRVDCRVTTSEGEQRFTRFLAVMTPSGPTAGRAPGFLFGVHSHPHQWSLHDKRLEAHAAGLAGIKVLRADAHWRTIQPTPEVWNFKVFDETVDTYAEQNIEIETLLGAPPRWAVKPGWSKLRPEFGGEVRPANAPYLEYLRRVAERYRGRIRFYEQFNEPDLSVFYNFSADDYAELFNEGAAVIRNADPGAVILTGGFATIRVVSSTNSPDYIETALAKTKGNFDLHAHHEHGAFENYQRLIDGPFHDLRVKLGIDDIPWYSNETAVHAAGGREKNQAAELWRKLLFAWSRGAVGYNWYDLRNDGFDPAEGEHNFGLITHDFQPKPVYVAYNTLTGLFLRQRFVRQLDAGPGGWLFEFANGEKRVLVGWLDPGAWPMTLLFRSDATAAERIDLMGNRTAVNVADGLLPFDLGELPTALELPAENRCEPAGRLIDVAFSGVMLPGRPFRFSLTVRNPSAEPAELVLQPDAPREISFDRRERRELLPAGAEKQLELSGHVAPGFRIPFGEQTPLFLRYRLGSRSGSVLLPLVCAVVVPANSVSRPPDFRIDRPEQNVNLVGFNPAQSRLVWSGAADLSADVRLAVRDRVLIVEVTATDDVHSQKFRGAELWRGDSVQFALNVPGRRGIWEIGAAHLDDGSSGVYIWSAPEELSPETALGSLRAETARQGNETVYRIMIPLAALGLEESRLQEGIRFNLQVNDNDGDLREGWMHIVPGIGGDKTVDQYPLVVFEK